MPKTNPLTKKRDTSVKRKVDEPLALKGYTPDITVYEFFNNGEKPRVEGLRFGVEVEIESHNDTYPSGVRGWRAVDDGSLRTSLGLRGGGKEFVSSAPFTLEETIQNLEYLDTALKKQDTQVKKTSRTSVHVHVNVQDLTMRQFVNFIMCYYILEPALCAYHGESRMNNHFALQLLHAPSIMKHFLQLLEHRSRIPYRLDSLKYCALNWTHVYAGRYGTVELRQGGGIDKSPLEIIDWLNMIEELYNVSRRYDNPQDIIFNMSGQGWDGFVSQMFPYIYAQVQPFIVQVRSQDALTEMFTKSIRTAQTLAFSIDWTSSLPDKKTETKGVNSRIYGDHNVEIRNELPDILPRDLENILIRET